MNTELRQHLRHNVVANILDGGFFGFAIGFASFVTILPLFVSTLTDSVILIGLIPAIHAVGWQLPQLLTANRVARQRRYKPMVVRMTIHERLPFLGLVFVALGLPVLGNRTALILTFLLLIWQGLGAGFTAGAWQSMIGKIIPPKMRGTFYGVQSSAANLLASGSAIVAGFLLARLNSPIDFAVCFSLASLWLVVSFFCLAATREPESEPAAAGVDTQSFWKGLVRILKVDKNFRWFLVVRMLSQVATMAFSFYTVYAVGKLGVSEVTIGIMTGVYLASQIGASPLMGWLGDRWSHRSVMEVGLASASASALLAWLAPSPAWFYLVFVLAGIANVAVWIIALAMILEFGSYEERPAYIGLANSLVAPATILAPLFGGLLAELAGYPAAFQVSAAGGLITLVLLHFQVKDPRRIAPALPLAEES